LSLHLTWFSVAAPYLIAASAAVLEWPPFDLRTLALAAAPAYASWVGLRDYYEEATTTASVVSWHDVSEFLLLGDLLLLAFGACSLIKWRALQEKVASKRTTMKSR